MVERDAGGGEEEHADQADGAGHPVDRADLALDEGVAHAALTGGGLRIL